MFEISEETKIEAVRVMREIVGDHPSDKQLQDAFDAAVAVVKAQFGM